MMRSAMFIMMLVASLWAPLLAAQVPSAPRADCEELWTPERDVLGIGIASAELFQGGTHRETVTEIFYRALLTPRVSLQPDVQYIASPSGIYRDALAVGVRFEIRQ